jgi:transcriptional regulator with XRE-family HTH domain
VCGMMHSVTAPRRGQPRPWPLGPKLEKLRGKAKLSIREASTKAGFSAATWSALEKGYKTPVRGQQVDYTPGADNVIAAARVVGMDAADALRLAGLDPAKAPEIRSGGRTVGEREILHLIAQLEPDVKEAMITLLRRLATNAGADGAVRNVPELPPVGAVMVYDTTPAPQDS